MEEVGVLLEFYKGLLRADNNTDKNKTLRALLQYVLGRKPSKKEYSMLFKMVQDYGYEIAFSALEFIRYSNANLSENYWGLVIWKCKELLRSSQSSIQTDNRLKQVVAEYNAFCVDNVDERKEQLKDLYEPI